MERLVEASKFDDECSAARGRCCENIIHVKRGVRALLEGENVWEKSFEP